MPKYNWTRVQFPNGEYGYVKTDNNDKATEYKSDGTFKVYSQPNEKSHSFYTSFETRPRTIQRVPDDHEAHLAQQKQVDEKVRQTTPSTGQMFDIATVGGLNNLSPTQWMRRVYDTGQLIQGYIPLNEYMNNLYFGNNGIVSDEYARKHPYRTMAANLAGDIATFGAASTLRKMPSWYRTMQAENQAVQDMVADNWRNITNNSVKRTRIGDVEIDNPELYYHQSGAGKAQHFVETGRMRTPTEEYWLAKEEAGEHIPLKLRTGVEPGYPQDPGSAMFAQGRLWYGLDPKNKPDLLVTAKEMPIANKNAAVMSDKASLKALESQGSRRVTGDNIYKQGPHNPQNTSAYVWEPGYGYKQIQSEISTYNHPEQFIHPAEAVRPGRQYVRPSVQKGMVSEPLMDSKSDLRAAITPEDLANRKFFSIEEYGPEPIYTRETVPQKIKVKKGDITESHMNDGTPGSEVTDANKVANEWFNKADHGQSVSYETDHSLSTDSYPIALLKMNRWQQQGLGQFIQSESAPKWMRLNRLGNKSFKELQEAIARVNKLTGQNYKIEQRLSPIIGSNGQPTLHPITGQPLMAKGIYVQPIGFFKYKKR